jgi:hypothetical protein
MAFGIPLVNDLVVTDDEKRISSDGGQPDSPAIEFRAAHSVVFRDVLWPGKYVR